MRKKTDIHCFVMTLICCFSWLFTPVCFAEQKNAFMQTDIKQAEPLYAGQRIPFYITLYSKTRFTGVPRFELPQVSGLILMEIEDRPVLGSLREQDMEFLTKTHEFAVFPQQEGRFSIPSFTVSFAYMDTSTNKAVEGTYKTKEIQINVTRPPGTKDITPLIATREFTVKAQWDPKPENPRVGDAFKQTITRTARDIPAMVFLPVSPEKINGLGIYENPSSVDDRMERGEFSGKLREIITYVCEQEGKYEIPEIVFYWFDLEKKELRTERLDPLVLNVSANPQYTKADPAMDNQLKIFDSISRQAVLLIFIVVLMCFGLFWIRKSILGRYAQWNQRRAVSEKKFFKTFETACRSNNDEKTLQALFVWINRLRSDTLPLSNSSWSIRKRFATFHDPDLLVVFTALERQAYGEPGVEKNIDPGLAVKLLDLVRQYRKYYLKSRGEVTKPNRLEPLNP